MSDRAKRIGHLLAPIGLAVWLAGAVAVWVAGRQRHWSPGELVLAAAAWVGLLAVIAREPVRHLFGPVFWHETTRVGRRPSTFLLRFLYVLVVCGQLTLMYLAWWQDTSRGAEGFATVLFVGAGAALLVFMCLAWWAHLKASGSTTFLYLGAGIAFLTLVFLTVWDEWYGRAELMPTYQQSRFASTFFDIFAAVQYLVILLLTPAYVAGAITDEKERKTIDYLFTTDLANREIVFGKLAARVATVILYVLAGLPVIAFLQLFGGIDPDLALANTAAALVTAVGLSAVAIALSAAARRSREAILSAYGLLLLYLLGSAVLASLMRAWSRWGYTSLDLFGWTLDFADAVDWLATGNAGYSLLMATNGGQTYDPVVINWLLGRYAVFWAVVSVLAVGWAVTRLRRVALRQSYGAVATKRSVDRQARSRPPIGNAPLVWREVFAADRRTGCLGWLFRIVIVGVAAIIPVFGFWTVFFGRSWYGNPTFAEQWRDYAEGMNAWVRVSTGVLTFLICMGAALRGASAVAGEKDRDTWVSLCATPVTVGEFLLAKWLGAVLSMRFALWVLVVIWAVGLALGSVYWFMILITIMFLSVFVSAFALAGIWCSLRARTALIANVRTFFLAVFMAGGFWLAILLCCIVPIGISGSGGRGMDDALTLPLGATPPFVTGMLPLGSFEKYDGMGPGPFHPEHVAIGPCAPFIGLGFWLVVNFLLLNRVRDGLTREMNRGRVLAERPDQKPRPALRLARPVVDPNRPPPADYSPDDPRMQD